MSRKNGVLPVLSKLKLPGIVRICKISYNKTVYNRKSNDKEYLLMKNKWKSVLAASLAVLCLFRTPSMASASEASEPPSDSETAQEASWPQGPDIVGESGIVMEVSTGTILYDKNMHVQHFPASITKIMTALLAIENCSLDEIVTVPHEAVYMDEKGSHIALDEGEQLTVEECLYAMMLASANDAAYSVAIHVGGTIENFAAMMNQRARELGCQNTNFVNPHGLHDDNHVTSAYDMALIVREALKHEIFRTTSGTIFYEIPPNEHQPDLIPMYNHQDMLTNSRYHYDGCFSGKTGYTYTAKNTLVTCAKRNNMELICVTMKTEGKQVYLDTASLLDFGFEHFKQVPVEGNESRYTSVPSSTVPSSPVGDKTPLVSLNTDCYVILPNDAEFSDLESTLSYGPNTEGSPTIGNLQYTYAGHPVGAACLDLTGSGLSRYTFQTLSNSISNGNVKDDSTDKKAHFRWWYIPLILLAVILLLAGLYVLLVFFRNYQYQKRRRQKKRKMKEYRSEFEDYDL